METRVRGAELAARGRLALEGIDERKVPAERKDVQFGLPFQRTAQQWKEQSLRRIGGVGPHEGTAVDVPSENEHGVPCRLDRGGHVSERRAGVLNQGHPAG